MLFCRVSQAFLASNSCTFVLEQHAYNNSLFWTRDDGLDDCNAVFTLALLCGLESRFGVFEIESVRNNWLQIDLA